MGLGNTGSTMRSKGAAGDFKNLPTVLLRDTPLDRNIFDRREKLDKLFIKEKTSNKIKSKLSNFGEHDFDDLSVKDDKILSFDEF